MSSQQNSSSTAYSQSHPPRPRPPLVLIIYDLKKRDLTSPIFVCLQCAKEFSTQQAMAGHCKKHAQSGMAKGTVEHIKYYPDHTYTFLCNNSQPSPPVSGSSADQILQPQPNKINQVPIGNYNLIFPYAGAPFIHDPTQDLISKIDTLPSLGNFQQYVGTEAVTSSSDGFNITMSQNPNGGGPSITTRFLVAAAYINQYQ
jgi:hypothetical protein